MASRGIIAERDYKSIAAQVINLAAFSAVLCVDADGDWSSAGDGGTALRIQLDHVKGVRARAELAFRALKLRSNPAQRRVSGRSR